MNSYPELLKKKLLSLIREMAEAPTGFVKNPEKDFSRKRKLCFADIICILLTKSGGSIGRELLEGLGARVAIPTVSAFTQQRDKILPEAMEYLFNKFTENIPTPKTFRGYRLLAGDGTNLLLPTNEHCKDTFIHANKESRGYNSIHLTALYDLCNNIHIDACIRPIRQMNEKRAVIDMVNRSAVNEKAVFIGDRAFEVYNVFAHLEAKGWHYLIRVKDHKNGIVHGLTLPETTEFDFVVERLLTRINIRKAQNPDDLYKYLPSRTPFDFLPLGSSDVYPMSFRVVRVLLDNGNIETLITNLPAEEFSPSDLKELYNKRWGVETSFRKLKHTIGLSTFHSKKPGGIVQEIFARLIMHNFVAAVINRIPTCPQGNRKYDYRPNFSYAVTLCRQLLRPWSNAPPDIATLIASCLVPVRPDRTSDRSRKIRSQSACSFNHRLA